MNLTVYLFGDFNNGYTQYPDDYTHTIFQKFYSNAKSTTQITIHREENLMYYGYIRKLEYNRYIGFCVVINGLMLTKFDELFSLFENTISTLVSNGQLIHFNEQGDIISTVDRLYVNREEIDFLTQLFSAGFNHFQNIVTPLPTINYSISKDTIKSFSVDDDLDEIVKSSYTFGYTYIFKSTGFNNYQLNSFKDVVVKLNNEITNLADLLFVIIAIIFPILLFFIIPIYIILLIQRKETVSKNIYSTFEAHIKGMTNAEILAEKDKAVILLNALTSSKKERDMCSLFINYIGEKCNSNNFVNKFSINPNSYSDFSKNK